MDHIVSSGVINIKISDHLPIFMVKKKQKTPSSSSFITGRSYANYNKETFQNDIKNHPRWLNFWEIEENKPSELWEIIFEIIKETANHHCPYRNIKIKDDTPQWINKEILSEINHKNYLYNKAKKLETPESWKLFQQKKNEVKNLLSTAKENFVKNKLDELEGNPRKFWRTINEISGIGNNKNSRKVTKIVDKQGNTLENMEAANFLNDFYVNVGPTLAK